MALTASQQATFNDMTQNYGMSPSQALMAMGQSGTTTVAEATGSSSGGGGSTSSGGSSASSGGGSVSSGGSSASASLTPAKAIELMNRSMTTGVPTSEMNAAGGYDAVKAVYEKNIPADQQYKRAFIPADDLKKYAAQVAVNGYGNTAILDDVGFTQDQAISYAKENNITAQPATSGNGQLAFGADMSLAGTVAKAGTTGGSQSLEKLYQEELGRAPLEAGLKFYQDRYKQLTDSGMSGMDAMASIRREIDNSPEGQKYDQTVTGADNRGLTDAFQQKAGQSLADIYKTEIGRDIDEQGSNFYNTRLFDLQNLGMSYEQALTQVRAEIDQSNEGAAYDQSTDPTQNMGLDGSLGSYQDVVTNSGIAGFDIGSPMTLDQLTAKQAEWADQGIDPLGGSQTSPLYSSGSSGQPIDYYGTGTTTTPTATGGTTGTTGTTGTGGVIGSTPSDMLTPFQKSVMAQNQALLGTYGSTAPNLNPYTQMVANQALSELDRQRQMTQQDIGYQATQAGAFGGSRHGVAEALTNEGFARQGANMLAPLMYQGYQSGVQNELARAAQMGNLGQQSFNYGTAINQMMSGAGAQQQALNQAQIDAAKAQTGAYQTYPSTGTGIFSQILGSAPHGQTSTYNPGLMDYLTLAASAAGAYATGGGKFV